MSTNHHKQELGFSSSWLDYLSIILGAFISGFALKSFLVPNHFLDGGVTGISLLIHEEFHIDLALLIILTNLPFVIMGAIQQNRNFAILSFAGSLIFALVLEFVPFPIFHYDKLITSSFGGFFLGLGVGLGMRGGCALDGIEVLALYTFKRTGFTISEIILGLNIIIFLTATKMVGFETTLYAILTYYTVTKTIDYVVEGIEEFTGLTIISSQSEKIKDLLAKQLNKGITVYKGERGFLKTNNYSSQESDILFMVTTRLEIRHIKNLVLEIDPKAFVFTSAIKEASGGLFKKVPKH